MIIENILDLTQSIVCEELAMNKKNNTSCDMGKSILHVKNSSGGFCKSQKKGRLGKNCIYFYGSGRCNRYEKWCTNSSKCPAYKKK